MDIALVRAALRSAELPRSDRITAALADLAVATARLARAEAEATISRRPSTLKATLKSTLAFERARQHVLAELRLVGQLTETHGTDTGSDHLRLCS